MADRRDRRDSRRDDDREELDERVVDITRVAKVIKGGRRFAFRTVVIVGDNKGHVGVGVGKARGVPDSIRKGAEQARKNMRPVALSGSTIPYEVTGRYAGAKVLLKPASPGTGVIAGGGVRAVLEAVGISDILTKSQGSPNLLNVTMATVDALEQLLSPEELAAMRGKSINHVRPFWERERSRDNRSERAAEAAEAVAEAEEEAPETAEAPAVEAEAAEAAPVAETETTEAPAAEESADEAEDVKKEGDDE